MSIQWTGADVVDIAVQTEVRGEKFYRQAAEKADSDAARDLFTHLADEEVRHKAIFEGLGETVGAIDLTQEMWEQAIEYISVTVDQAYFKADAPIRAIPEQATVPDMLRQAIAFEQQSVLFFYTLRDMVRSASQGLVTSIIDEEKQHVRQLSAALKATE